MPRRFRNRTEAGRLLAGHLLDYTGRPDVVVLGLARGGVPVAWEVAWRIAAPLDVLVVRKLGVPGEEELAMGAIGPGGAGVLDEELIGRLRIDRDAITAVCRREQRELERREYEYRGARPPPAVRGKTVIVVDDGIATGSTMRAAIGHLRAHQAARIVAAAPVIAEDTLPALRSVADEVVFVLAPADFGWVGKWFEEFPPTTDDEVRSLLGAEQGRMPS
jgi:putative phosphoribosyl transferase